MTLALRATPLLLAMGCRIGFEPVAADGMEGRMDALTCPAEYSLTLPSSTSRYRITSVEAVWKQHYLDCADDEPGSTHLVTIDDVAEVIELAPLLDAVIQPNANRFNVGAVQMPDQVALDTAWIGMDGEPVPPDAWGPTEPDDLDDVEDNLEQRAAIGSTRRMLDIAGYTAYGAICECDGRPVADVVVALVGP